MAIKNVVYGLTNALQNINPATIVSQRAPTVRDKLEIGSFWIDSPNQDVYCLVDIVANAAQWVTSPSSPATILASLQITGVGGLDVQNAGSTTTISSGTINFDNAAATTTLAGNLTVTGVTTINGDLDLTSAALIDLTSTANLDPSILLRTNGGVVETMQLTVSQGTSVDSLDLQSVAGGVTIEGGLATADAINITSTNAAGGIDVDAGTAGITIDSTGAFSIDGAAASNVTTTGAGIDLTLNSVLGSVLVRSTEDAALAIRLHANGGVSETIQLHSDLGTGVGSINLLSDVGGLTLRATGLASADAINLEAVAGGIDMDSALQTNITSSQAAATALRLNASDAAGGIDVDAGTGGMTLDTTGAFSIDGAAASNVTTTGAGIDLTLSSVLGSVLVSSTEDAALAIRLHANGGTSETIQLHSDQGTGVGSVNLLSDVGGLTLRATGLASADAINLEAAAGGIDMDAALQMNMASSQAAVDALRLNASDAAGGIDVDAGTGGITVDTTGALSFDSAAASNFTVTGAFDLSLVSTLGSVVVSGSEVAADAIQLTTAANGGITVNASSLAMVVNRAVNVAAAAGINAFTSTSLTTGVAGVFTSSAATVSAVKTVNGGFEADPILNAAGASPQIVNARHGQVLFTDVIANGGYGTLTLTNSTITANSILLVSPSCATVNSAVAVVGIVPAAGSVALRLFNGGSAATNVDILINFWNQGEI